MKYWCTCVDTRPKVRSVVFKPSTSRVFSLPTEPENETLRQRNAALKDGLRPFAMECAEWVEHIHLLPNETVPEIRAPSDDAVADTLRFNQRVEAHVRRVPDQYLWLHKRFKGLAPGYPDVYGDRPLDRDAAIAAANAATATAVASGGRFGGSWRRHSTSKSRQALAASSCAALLKSRL